MAAQRSDADNLVNVDWLANAFDFSRPEVAQFEVTLDQMSRILANYDAARRRHGLHPRREVGRMTHRGVLSVPAAMDHPQDYFTGIDPDTDLDSRLAPLFELLAATAKRGAHRERRVQRALRMVLVCDRRAKQRENPVACRLHDVAVVEMRRVDHQLERWVDNCARLFGVKAAHQLGRAF